MISDVYSAPTLSCVYDNKTNTLQTILMTSEISNANIKMRLTVLAPVLLYYKRS